MSNPFEEDMVGGSDDMTSHQLSKGISDNISYTDIASKLIKDNLLLTALELHTELVEAGREVTKLKEFFSNPGNFEQQASAARLDPTSIRRSSSQVTLDSLDLTRYSEDGERGIDERVAVLEFELRKAKETISSLRTNLTEAADSESTTPEAGSSKLPNNDLIKPHEQRALNFLLNEYLLLHNYKLTSITFADENEDQDFEDWDDVGLNIPKPTELLNLYRDFMRQSGHSRLPCTDSSCQTELPTEEIILENSPKEDSSNNGVQLELLDLIEQLKEKILSLEQDKEELRRLWTTERLNDISNLTTPGSDLGIMMINETMSTHSGTPERFELIEAENKATDEVDSKRDEDGNISLADTDTEWTRVTIPHQEITHRATDIATPSSPSPEVILPTAMLHSPISRTLPASFQHEVFARCFVNTSKHQEKHLLEEILQEEITEQRLVHILGQSLPRIIPNVILNKREEVLPLIVATIHLHPVASERDRLLHLLFNLKKRPQEDERLMILAGIVGIARCSGLNLVENEILPQCWEQIGHRHVERRLLVAESCSALAPYVSSPIRNSLMLSMLQQMLLEDKSELVREAVIKSLSLIITFIDDADKYFQCEELALTALDDSSPNIVSTTTHVFLPVLAKWALDLDKLQTRLLTRLSDRLKTHILDKNIMAIEKLLPYVVISVVCAENVIKTIGSETPTFDCQLGDGLTNPSVFYEGEFPIGLIMGAFDLYVDQEYYEEWEELEWVFSTFLPALLDVVQEVDTVQETVVTSFVQLFRGFCAGFGSVITRTKVKPQFTVRLQNLEKSLANGRGGNEAQPSLAIIPVYLVGVLATGQGDSEDISHMLKRFLFGLPLCGCRLTALETTVKGLCRLPCYQGTVLAALWEAVVHPRPVVRHAAAELLAVTVGSVADSVMAAKVVPALVTLASDSDISVRTATITAFGSLITSTTLKEVHDKTYMQLQSFLSDPVTRDNHVMLMQLVITMGHIVTSCEPWFREEVILPQLAAMAAYTLQLPNLTKRLDLANVLIEAFASAVYCTLSKQTISTALLPGLRYLEPISAQSLTNHRDTVLTMIQSAESRIDVVRPMERSGSISLAAATANVGQGMEDMKKRVSNIFTKPNITKPTNLPNLQGIFRKKQ